MIASVVYQRVTAYSRVIRQLVTRHGLGTTLDSFNHSSSPGAKYPVTAGDITEMDVIGYDLVPEPSTVTLLSLGIGCLLGYAWHARQRTTRA